MVNCSASSSGVVYGSLAATNSSNNWTTVSYVFNATSVNSTFIMVIAATNQYGWVLDDFSVTDVYGNQSLINGNFETNSSTDGWTTYPCQTSGCASVTNSSCSGGSSSCFTVTCATSQVLEQIFSTIPGQMYTFSFNMRFVSQTGGNPANNNLLTYSIT